MNRSDINAFFADEMELNRDEHVFFTYLFETLTDPMEAAAELCSESSTAQWKRPGHDEDFRPDHAAKVVNLETLGENPVSSFGEAAPYGERYVSVKVRIAHPFKNFGARIPNLLTAAMGEGVFHCGSIPIIKLIDIEFPDSYLNLFEGPRFGTSGIRKILNVFDRPLFFGVVKPNVGLDPASFSSLALEAWKGGLDAAKDDEMLSDPDYSPFKERMNLVGKVMREAEDSTGEKKIFIANITDEVARLKELHDIAVGSGINAVMVNVMALGLSAVRFLREFSQVPIVAHFDCIAPMSRHPGFGISSSVITKLERLCGCDAIIMPGFGERMMTPEEEVLANVEECSKPLSNIKSSLAVPGGSDFAGTLPSMYEKLRTIDFACVPGRGVFGHPMGPKAGAQSLRQAWEAIVNKISLEDYANDHVELAEALKAFGNKETKILETKEASKADPIIKGYTGVSLFFKQN